jgi:acetaldehyde dehydrogenase (acetylating)
LRGDQDALVESASCGCFVLGSKSAGFGIHANIEELTETTSRVIGALLMPAQVSGWPER